MLCVVNGLSHGVEYPRVLLNLLFKAIITMRYTFDRVVDIVWPLRGVLILPK